MNDLSARDLEIKRLFRLLVESAGGNRAAKDKVRVNGSRISDYCSPNNTAMPPADVIADLESALGDPLVTRYLADLRGYLLVEKRDPDASCNLLVHTATSALESGEALAAMASSHGCTDRAVLEAAQKEIGEAIQAFTNAKHAIEADLKVLPLPVRQMVRR